MDTLPLGELPEPPPAVDAAGVLARLVETLGFRYHWATEGLRSADLAFAPAAGAMELRALLRHIHALVVRVDVGLGGVAGPVTEPADDELRAATLSYLHATAHRLRVGRVDLAARPGFWRLINGPLTDALTHVGQINAWRRACGNPAVRVRFMEGKGPSGI